MLRRTTAGIAVAVAMLAATVTGAQATIYQIDPVHSNVEFTIRHLVGRVSGSFTGLTGSILYDPAQPDSSAVVASIDVATVVTHNERRDKDLKSPNFFDAERYPSIDFSSTGVVLKGDRLMVTGDLTMHGVTRQPLLEEPDPRQRGLLQPAYCGRVR